MENLIIPSVAGFVTALITWFFSRRKSLAEDRGVELDNAITAVKYYREMLDDMGVRLTSATATIKAMELQHRELMLINQQLVDELQKFKQLNGKTT